MYYFSLVPVALIFAGVAFYSLNSFLLLTVFLVPLSVPLSELIPGLSFNLYMPTEPMLLGILLLFIFKALYDGKLDRRILYHPVSIAIYINLFWIFLTTLTSTMPVVSVKYLTARIWFLIGFYFLAAHMMKNYRNTHLYLWAYIIPFLIIIVYTLVSLAPFGFLNRDAAHSAMKPFYNDHTSYGAILAMFLFVLLGYFSQKGRMSNERMVLGFLILFFLFAITLSYTRATWVSILASIIVFVIIKLRIKFRTLVIIGLVIGGVLFAYRSQIIMELEQNRQDSSSNMMEHVQSIYNIKSDPSNVERLNRWAAALEMFKERPVVGWGPGTYMFQYAPFQMSYNRTVISTNFGDWGNAHSEYIGPLAEEGFMGTISFILIIITVTLTALRVYFRTSSQNIKVLCLSIYLGLVTYYTYGMLNNLLTRDKAAAHFWGFTAILVAMDIYHKHKTDEELKKEEVKGGGSKQKN